MTIVYMMGTVTEEIRYSLRSLVNYPHDNVVFVGNKPDFVQNVDFIQGNLFQGSFRNTTYNLVLACKSNLVSDDFLLFNDDFFITEPTEYTHYNRGTIADFLKQQQEMVGADSNYARGMVRTMAVCGLKETDLCYEVHAPIKINKKNYLEMYKKYQDRMKAVAVFHKRTLYGNLYPEPSTKVKDFKVLDTIGRLRKPITSTSDLSFKEGVVGRQIRNMFSQPCKYEKSPPKGA